MKSNAIVRIVLFSLVIIILVGILLAGLGFKMFSALTFRNEEPGSATGNMGSVEASSIRNIKIEWLAGTITVSPDPSTEDITFCESGKDAEEYPMVWNCKGDTLTIQFEESRFGIHHNSVTKDLIILVPAKWVCNTLEIDAASAEVEVNDLTINEVDFDGASGLCTFTGCAVGSFDVDTASGDVTFQGSLNTRDISAMSANCDITLSNSPKTIDMESMSGDLNLYLPADCGFSVTMDAMSSDFSSVFDTTTINGAHVHGDGSCRIDIDAMSGAVSIYKAK